MMLYPLIVILLTLTSPSAAVSQTDLDACLPADSTLTLAWVEQGNLFIWQNDHPQPIEIAAGDALQAFVAPDGEHIAFTRTQHELLTSLWLANADGSDVRQLADIKTLSLTENVYSYINQVEWLNANTLIFNTALDLAPYNDLHLLDITTGEIQVLLPPGQGGEFTLSPDGQWIAVVYHGTYGNLDGHIRLIKSDSSQQLNLITFAGVSSGSESRFYPRIFWEADSTALRLALPDPDLIYDESAAPPTTLWRLTTDGSAEQIGAVPSNFFGLPTWSSDSRYLTYMQRVGNPSDNRFDLILADGNGANPVVYAAGLSTLLPTTIWIPGSQAFFYIDSTEFMIGTPDQPPKPFTPTASAIQLLDNGYYLYATDPSANYELRLAQIDTSLDCPIMPFKATFSALDAVLH